MQSRARVSETAGASRPSPLCDADFALWIEEQVAALRRGDLAALDVEYLTLELEGLTKRDERALGSQLKRVMAHLLKQQHQPERATSCWEDTVENGREEIADILEQSPSLRRRLPCLMSKKYPIAVSQAARDTRRPPQAFPSEAAIHSRRGSGRDVRLLPARMCLP